MSSNREVNLLEGMFRGILKSETVSLRQIVIALHNACCHGDNLPVGSDQDGEINDYPQIQSKIYQLKELGFYVGVRNPERNKSHSGKFMVAEQILDYATDDASQGGFCIVGDKLSDLVNEAYEFVHASIAREVKPV